MVRAPAFVGVTDFILLAPMNLWGYYSRIKGEDPKFYVTSKTQQHKSYHSDQPT